MKQKILVSMLAAFGIAPTLAYATNGDAMMAVGSQNTALGGTGVAHYVGAESAFANPAMLGKSAAGSEVTGGITWFNPKVTNDGMSGGAVVANSSATNNFIPDVSYSMRASDNLTYGIGMAGIAGMGVDYSGANAATHMAAKTSLSIMKVIPTIAYNTESFGIGFSPILQYGSLAISYTGNNPGNTANSDTNFGFSLGGYVNAGSATLAASYFSAIKMVYGKQLSNAGLGFGQTFADRLDQPAELKAGISLAASDSVTLTADVREIQWGSAAGYREFGWMNQTVAAIGAKYAGEGYWLGLGYNSANNPIGVYANGTMTPYGNNGGVVNMFNNLMFPATIKDSFTFGAGYSMSNQLSLEGSVMYAPKVTTRVDISDAAMMAPGSLYNTTTHSQQAVSLSLRYKF